MGLICQWIQSQGKSGMSKCYCEEYDGRSVYFNLKDVSLNRRKKSKNRWQMGYHRKLNKEKIVSFRARDLNSKSLHYKTKVLSNELSF